MIGVPVSESKVWTIYPIRKEEDLDRTIRLLYKGLFRKRKWRIISLYYSDTRT